MSETEIAVQLEDIGKQYRIYQRPIDRVVDVLGLDKFRLNKTKRYHTFWALRHINLILPRGGRIGFIGRNGAGKSTLLKVITGNIPPTEGTSKVKGTIQALMTTGTGFHPEFTGRHNIRASLSYQGISVKKQREIEEEVIDFTELEEFIDQPVKTYSTGMYARLAFTVATAIEPDLLVIDEVLGAGDAYFASKCAQRMNELTTNTGATVLLVSHSTDSILRYCDECIWLERGKVVQQGQSMEVTKAYNAFIHELEDKRLKQKEKRRQGGVRSEEQLENLEDSLSVAFVVQGGGDEGFFDISEAVLLHNGEEQEKLLVGGVQDATLTHPAYVLLTGSQWGDSRDDGEVSYRQISLADANHPTSVSYVIFRMKTFTPEDQYALHIRYRTGAKANVSVSITHKGEFLLSMVPVPSPNEQWTEQTLPFGAAGQDAAAQTDGDSSDHGQGDELSPGEDAEAAALAVRKVSRWTGSGELLIQAVRIFDGEGREIRVFRSGEELNLEMTIEAQVDGDFQIIPCAVLYRLDGICVTNTRGAAISASLRKGQRRIITMTYPDLNFDDGNYVFSVAVYKTLDRIGESQWYDLMDRSYEIKLVDGADRYWNGLFQHPAAWSSK